MSSRLSIFRSVRFLFAAAIAALVAIPIAQAGNVTWTGTTTPGDWNTGSNWVGSSAPSTTDTAVFSSINSAQVIRVHGTDATTKTIAGMVFSNTGTTAIEGGNAAGTGSNTSLIIGSGGITINSGAGAVTLGNSGTPFRLAVALSADQAWTNNSSSLFTKQGAGNSAISLGNFTLTISGSGNTTINPVIGSTGGGLIKSGTGTLTLTASAHTYTGATTVTSGTLIITSSQTSINSTSGLSVASGAKFTNNNASIAYSKSLTLAEGALINGVGAFAPTAMTITADLSNGFTTFALGTTSLTKAGNLELTLSGVSDGTYTIFSGSALSSQFTTMSIGGVSLTSGGSGNFSGLAGGKSYSFTNSTNELLVAIPEPATWALLAFSLTTVMVLRRRRS